MQGGNFEHTEAKSDDKGIGHYAVPKCDKVHKILYG